MATKDECAAALDRLAAKLSGADEHGRAKAALDRTVSCLIPDLGVTFHGTLKDSQLAGVTVYDADPVPSAQIRLVIGSDDLLRLVDGELTFASGWATGRVKVNASFGDLLRLRGLI